MTDPVQVVQVISGRETSIETLGKSYVAAYLAPFATRAALVAWAARVSPNVGQVVSAAGYSYRYDASSTAISDLPGWVPDGAAFFEHFKAAGDGSTNDTAALNSATAYSASAGAKVLGRSGATYLVAETGTKSSLNAAGAGRTVHYAVTIPTGAQIDWNGATVKLTTGATCAAIVNGVMNAATDVIICENLIINGNGGPGSVTELVLFYGLAEGSRLCNVEAKGFYGVGIALYACDGCEFSDLWGRDAQGNAVQFGGNTQFQNTRCVVTGRMGGVNLSYDTSGNPGNPVLIGAVDCQFPILTGRNTASGHKVTANSQFLNIAGASWSGEVIGAEADNRTTNSGFKIQGDTGSRAKKISVGAVVSRLTKGPGLYIREAETISIASYMGTGNAITGTDADLDFDTFENLRIGQAWSDLAGQRGLALGSSAGRYTIESLIILNNKQTSANGEGLLVAAGQGYIGYFEGGDTQNGATTMGSAISIGVGTAAGTYLHIQEARAYYTSGGVKTVPGAPFTGRDYGKLMIERAKLATGADALSGVVTLSAGVGYTQVTNENVRSNSQTVGFMYPDIKLTPVNAAARTLLASGPVYATINTGNFRITPPAAAAGTEQFRWEIGPWAVVAAVVS